MSVSLRYYPTANGSDTSSTPVGDTPAWKCVDDLFGAEDDDTTYAEHGGGTFRSGFAVTVPTYVVGVSTVKVEARLRAASGAENQNLYVLLSASYTDDTASAPGTSYVNWTSASLARPGGGNWAPADLRDASFNIGWQTVGAVTFKRLTRINGLFSVQLAFAGILFMLPPTCGALMTLTAAEWVKLRALLASGRPASWTFDDATWERAVAEARCYRPRSWRR